MLAVEHGGAGHEQDPVLGLERSLHHPHQHHHADVVVEPGVDDQRLQGRVRIALRRRDPGNHGLEHVIDTLAGLGAHPDRVACVDADDVLDLGYDALGLRHRQVDLVEHRHDLDALLEGGVAIRDRLRLDALRGVDHQQRSFARSERARNFVGEIDVARSVDQMQAIRTAIARLVRKRRRLCLDGDAALTLQIHRVEHLLTHLALRQTATALYEAVGQRGFPVVDVGDDRKVAYVLHENAKGTHRCPRMLLAALRLSRGQATVARRDRSRNSLNRRRF